MDDMLRQMPGGAGGSRVENKYLDHKPYLRTARVVGRHAERDAIEHDRQRLLVWIKFLSDPEGVDMDSEFLVELQERHKERMEAMGMTPDGEADGGGDDASSAGGGSPAGKKDGRESTGGLLSGKGGGADWAKHTAKKQWGLLSQRTAAAAERQRDDRSHELGELRGDDSDSDDDDGDDGEGPEGDDDDGEGPEAADGDESDGDDGDDPVAAAARRRRRRRKQKRNVNKWAKRVRNKNLSQGPGPALSSLAVTVLAGSSVASSDDDGESIDLNAFGVSDERFGSMSSDDSFSAGGSFDGAPGHGSGSFDRGSFDSVVGDTVIVPLPPPADDGGKRASNQGGSEDAPPHIALDVAP